MARVGLRRARWIKQVVSVKQGLRAAVSVIVAACCPLGLSAAATYDSAGLGTPVPTVATSGDVGYDSVLVDDGSAGALSDAFVGHPTDGCCNTCTGPGTCAACGSRQARCYPPGIAQILAAIHDNGNACWVGQAEALILWRNAPPDRPLLDGGITPGLPLLNANGLDSEAAAGPRLSVMRVNNCTGNAVEATYLRASNFRSQRPLSLIADPYALAPPGIYGNANVQPFDTGNANLGARLQSFELNHRHCHGPNLRFLAGFRWIEWQEQFTLQGAAPGISDFYQTNCFNDLYGGQIGLDAHLLSFSWIRFDSIIKAGVYYNNAVQASEYTTNDPTNPGTASVTIGESPASGAFAGELGLTGVIPLANCIDFRFGYYGLWLSGIAQPTQQLSGQQLTPGLPAIGTITTNGGVVVQGVSIGLEGRW